MSKVIDISKQRCFGWVSMLTLIVIAFGIMLMNNFV